ncbi:MalM family protein [Celerinatantimonas sp. YJH-8]|uniref:MalM family protein n=1 Tax=Celerinatantimonas sp. YJH-8 TaxID=3228714 RepID=UPI0038C90798
MKHALVVLGLAGILTGCSSMLDPQSQDYSDITPSDYTNLIKNSSVCCQQYATLPYQTIQASGEYLQSVTPKSSVFKFEEGRSFFKAFKLESPSKYSYYNVTIDFDISQSLFLPKIVVLNDKFEVTGVLDNQFFKQKPNHYMLQGDIERQLTMGGPEHRYLVIYQPQDQLADEFKVETELAIYNRAHAFAAPPDPIRYKMIHLQPFGRFSLKVQQVSLLEAQVQTGSSTEVVSAQQPSSAQAPSSPAAQAPITQPSAVQPVVVAMPSTVVQDQYSQKVAVPATSGDASGHVLTPDKALPKHPIVGTLKKQYFYSSKPYEVQMEEQRLFNDISKALKANDYNRAVALYKEARQHGINDASQIFAQALSQQQ